MKAYFAGVQDLSSVDYPGHMCSVVFFQGCNLKCRFCYNYKQQAISEKTSLENIFKKLKKNLGIVDSIILSGGEALIYEYAILKIKEWTKEHELLLGVETNGTFNERLNKLIKKNIFDFVAMDIKSNFNKEDYKKITGFSQVYKEFEKSFKLVKNGNIAHEFRMTVTPTLHSLNDIKNINEVVKPSKLVLQRFQPGENVLDKSLNDKVFSAEFIKDLKKYAKTQKNVELRFWE
ncbi:MAG: anaerobic ribonucleoside-triphosphate reductase activating protein [Candidatus Nanoarchaeia archaeon]|nr:anaerobic ribonucleoside-triphosphate reductase activating protein [Candidatus Nanoarchaeia archaeon]